MAEFKYQEYLEDKDLSIAFHVVNDKSTIRIVDNKDFETLITGVLEAIRQKILKVAV
jgi:flagellar biosynthesis regulator FlaF